MSQMLFKKILIIRLSSIGDVLLTTPLIRRLKSAFPESQIDYITTRLNFDILRLNPYIDDLIEYDKSAPFSQIQALKKQISSSDYDLIIDLQNNLRTAVLLNGINTKISKFNKRRLYKLKLIYLKNRVSEYKFIPDLFIDSINNSNISKDDLGLEFWLKSDINNNFYPFKEKKSDKQLSIAIAPGAHHFTKRWQLEKFTELSKLLIKKYSSKINLIGGSEDIEIANLIRKSLGSSCSDYSGKLSLAESAEVINTCDLTISNDSSIMHISASRNVPVVAIFGSTVPELGFAPYKVKNAIVEIELSCRPCTHIGKKKCPKGHFNCMNLISVSDVAEAVDSIFK